MKCVGCQIEACFKSNNMNKKSSQNLKSVGQGAAGAGLSVCGEGRWSVKSHLGFVRCSVVFVSGGFMCFVAKCNLWVLVRLGS